MQYTHTLSVLGAGSYGTALAMAVAGKGLPVLLWARDSSQAGAMQQNRVNAKYLPDIRLPDSLEITDDFKKTVTSSQIILLVIPSHIFRDILHQLKPLLKPDQKIVYATKGLDRYKGHFLSDTIIEILGENTKFAALSGPTFASELAKGMPTAIAIAGNDRDFLKEVCALMHTSYFIVYISPDLKSLQLGGAVKNVIAIATGMSDGLGFGANARTALITRGLTEMIRLGLRLGATDRGFMGLSGLGDLVLTCTDNQSRNRRFGYLLGKGYSVDEALKEIGQVVEGINSTKEIYELANMYGVQMPICSELYEVLEHGKSGKDAAASLLAKEHREDSESLRLQL